MNFTLPKAFQTYKPQVSFCIDEGNFLIKTAQTPEELAGAFHLRHNVFYKERNKATGSSQISIDEFDIHGDQLIIIDKIQQEVVGAYRFIPSQGEGGSQYFCNRKFFDINPFIKKIKNHNTVEMEWACTHKSLRASRAIHYLWLGMARYFKLTFSKYLCGQVNVLNSSAEESAGIYQTFLEQNMTSREDPKTSARILPTPAYRIKNFDKILSQARADKKYLSQISRLFWWYLKMGAKVHGPPMFDPEFQSYGFFMSLDFKNIRNPLLVKHYEDAVYLRDHLPD